MKLCGIRWGAVEPAVLGAVLIYAVTMSPARLLGAPLTTVFTYQGQLKESGAPFSGDVAIEFVLFAVPTGGTPLSSTLISPVTVVDGLFSVQLDFGASAFPGADRWLEIGVERVTLTPRQRITATPYALYALDSSPGNSLDASDGSPINAVFVDASGNVGVGTTVPGRKLDIGGASAGARITNGTIDGPHLVLKSSSTDTVSHTVGALDFVDLEDTRLGGMTFVRSFLGDRLIFSVAEQDQVFVDQDGRVGIGTTFPAVPLHVEGGAEATLAAGGYLALGTINGANLVMDSNEIQARSDEAAAPLLLNPAGGDVVTGGDLLVSGSIGVGTSSPTAPLHVTSGSDAEPVSGGMVVIGATSGANIAIDNNEIMARSDGVVAPLYLNNDGGDIICGGPIDIGYQIVSSSSSGPGVQVNCPAGKLAIGGGCDCGTDLLTKSRPLNGGTTWDCVCDGDGVAGYAICAKVK